MDNDCVASDPSVVWPQGKRKIGPIHQNMMLDHLPEETRAFIFRLKYNVTVARNKNQADMGEL